MDTPVPSKAVQRSPAPSFRLLLDRAMHQARPHFHRVFWPVALPVAAVGTATIVLYTRMMGRLAGADPAAMNPLDMFGSGCVTLPILLVVSFLLSQLGYTAFSAAAVDISQGKVPAMGECWRFALKPQVLGTLFLFILLYLGGLVFLILPGLVVYLLMAFITPVMRAEGIYGPAALGRSLELSLHHPPGAWLKAGVTKVLAVLTVGWLIQTLLGALAQIPMTAVQSYLQARDLAAGGTGFESFQSPMVLALTVVSTMMANLMATGVAYFMRSILVALYQDQVLRREGADLEAAIGRMTGPALEVAAGAQAPPA